MRVMGGTMAYWHICNVFRGPILFKKRHVLKLFFLNTINQDNCTTRLVLVFPKVFSKGKKLGYSSWHTRWQNFPLFRNMLFLHAVFWSCPQYLYQQYSCVPMCTKWKTHALSLFFIWKHRIVILFCMFDFWIAHKHRKCLVSWALFSVAVGW